LVTTGLKDPSIRRLRTTDDGVKAIAAELGYSDARSLRRFLKAATGTTPQQLRAESISAHSDDGAVRSRLQVIGVMMGA
jgi:AraC-like DNA-binding protein